MSRFGRSASDIIALDASLLQHGVTALLNLAVAIAVGASATLLWTTSTRSPWALEQACAVRRVSLVVLAVALMASAGGLWLKAAAMAEVPMAQAAPAASAMLNATHLGLAWKIGMAALALAMAMAAMALARPGCRQRALMLAGFLYTRSMVSHASADGDFSFLVLVDWLHLIAPAIQFCRKILHIGFDTLHKIS